MFIGGFQKNSLIDYPGKISAVLFLSGCNFDCPYCHNPDLARPCREYPHIVNPEMIFAFLQQRKQFLDGVVISGGEPTLQKDLAGLCDRIKQMGYPVKMDTNGSRPRTLRELIKDGLVDYIAMDVKTNLSRYPSLIRQNCRPDDVRESIRLILSSGLPHEFKTTCIKPLVSRKIVEEIVRLIEGADLYALQRFQETETLHPSFFQNNDFRIDDREMAQFQSTAQSRVASCIIR